MGPLSSRAAGSLPALAGLLALVIPAGVSADPPDTITLNGTVRDFRKAHDDFEVDPIDGTGHYAGNVALMADASGRPMFTGNGFLVGAQWRNSGNDPIPPHLCREGAGGGGVYVTDDPDVHGNATFDTWDSSLGPYGGSNVGPAPDVVVGAPMPDITIPTGLGPSVGDVSLADGTLSDTLHCDDLTITGTVEISGGVTILCEGDFEMATHSDVELLPGATIALYVMHDVTFMPHTNFNANTGLPALATIYVLGDDELRIGQPLATVYATIIAPNAHMVVMPNAEFFGTFTGKSPEVKPNAGFHVDGNVAVPMDICGNVLNDAPGFPAVNSTGAISSADSFAQWYRDVLGENLAAPYPIMLALDGDGVYEFSDDAFYPIDDMLFGNEGDDHNYFFTYAIAAYFEYEACTGQFLEFAGADDAWVFVDDAMGIDLGGLRPNTEQVLELDRLELVDGETYEMRFFFAHRHPGTPGIHLRSNIAFWNDDDTVVAHAACD